MGRLQSKTLAQPDSTKHLNVLLWILMALGLCRLILPGDTYFINDEPKLVLRALDDNAAGVFTTHGLRGSRGVDYGPFAIWMYRIGFSLSHNLYALLCLRIFFVALLSGAAVYVLARLCPELFAPFGATALLSPYLWFYGRDLWDNSLVIPLGAVAFVSYLAFCRHQNALFLAVSALAATCAFLTHLMVIPLLATLSLHFIFFQRSWLVSHWKNALFIAALCFSIGSPYFFHLLKQHPAQAAGTGNLGHLFTPLLGARFFTDLGVEYILDSRWIYEFTGPVRYAWWACLGITVLAYPLSWLGMAVAGREIAKQWNRREKSILFHACFLSLTALLVQMAVSFVYRLIPIPYIHSSLWLFYFFFLWLGLSRAVHLKVRRLFFPAYAFSLSLALVVAVTMVHVSGGNREQHYGPTLANQMELVRRIKNYGAEKTWQSSARYAWEFPWAVEALLRLSPPSTAVFARAIEIRYVHPESTKEGKVTLSVKPPDSDG